MEKRRPSPRRKSCSIGLFTRVFYNRKLRRWTIEHLAELAGVSTTTIKEVEKGRYPKPGTIDKIAKAFGMKPDDLITTDPNYADREDFNEVPDIIAS